MASSRNTIKDELRTKIIRDYGFSIKTRALILLDLSNPDIIKWFMEAGEALGISFISLEKFPLQGTSDAHGFDAFISDLHSEKIHLIQMIQSGVVPIVPRDNPLGPTLSEFDPMKFTGNAFLYEKETIFHIFEKLVRYLENIRYPGDKRTLLSNLEKTL